MNPNLAKEHRHNFIPQLERFTGALHGDSEFAVDGEDLRGLRGKVVIIFNGWEISQKLAQ